MKPNGIFFVSGDKAAVAEIGPIVAGFSILIIFAASVIIFHSQLFLE